MGQSLEQLHPKNIYRATKKVYSRKLKDKNMAIILRLAIFTVSCLLFVALADAQMDQYTGLWGSKRSATPTIVFKRSAAAPVKRSAYIEIYKRSAAPSPNRLVEETPQTTTVGWIPT